MIDYVDNVWLLCRFEGSVFPEAFLQALLGTFFALLFCLANEWWPSVREESGWAGLNIVGLTWSAMTACLVILLGLRIKQALGRFWEGTSLLHQMRGEWFDAASCLITFSRDSKINRGMSDEVDEFRSTLIRLMSLMHGSALDEISDSGVSYEVIDIGGLDTKTLMFLRDCQSRCNFSKVEALQHLIQVLVTDCHHSGILSIPSPILSRTYQTLSRGFVNLLNARKIKDTMFPFPFVQTMRMLILVHTIVTPAVMTTVLDTNFWSLLFTFFPLFGLHCLNLTAWQLEMPFGADPNDLPLAQFQKEMNDTLLMLISEGADHLPGTSNMAVPLIGEKPTKRPAIVGHSRTVERTSFFFNRSLPSSSEDSSGGVESSAFTSAFTSIYGSQRRSHNRQRLSSKIESHTRSFFESGFFETRSSEDSNCGFAIKSLGSSCLRDSSRRFGESLSWDSFGSTRTLDSTIPKVLKTLPTIYSADIAMGSRQVSPNNSHQAVLRLNASHECRCSPLVAVDENAMISDCTPRSPPEPGLLDVVTPTTPKCSPRSIPQSGILFNGARSGTSPPSPKFALLREVGSDTPAGDHSYTLA